eukprot:13332168-Ditylum_brightwellii.AAC.1
MTWKLLDPTPFLCISNEEAELIRDIKICTQLGSLGQIFAEPTSLYIKPVPAPPTTPAKCPTSHLSESTDADFQKKKWK